ncbi:hypothetical protein BRADI_1g09133v3 [Brachypodium distachyon]|uniref:Uncharacterized protein n=1 Tax=Brachypodium distachyon TaxID=15368 RepID=A0A0Q3RJK7_BRADI|nr:hypothetical protein BRADI_1g09133v3 [Brachypodium distachyon]
MDKVTAAAAKEKERTIELLLCPGLMLLALLLTLVMITSAYGEASRWSACQCRLLCVLGGARPDPAGRGAPHRSAAPGGSTVGARSDPSEQRTPWRSVVLGRDAARRRN